MSRTVRYVSIYLALVAFLASAHAQEHRPKAPRRPKQTHPHALGAKTELLDTTAPAANAPSGGAIAQTTLAAVDLTANCPPIFNQGGFGSCTSCATGYCIKGYYEKVEHGWDVTQSAHQFSPAYVYNQVNGGSDGGSYVSDNFNLIVWRGITTLDVQPYGADVTTWPTQDQCQEAAQYRNGQVSGSNYLTLANSNLSGIKSTVAAGTPCDICIYVDSAWDYLGSGTNYVWYPNSQNIRGGHCITIVGYDDNVTDGAGHVGAFKVQNSWGTGWGQGGYAWIAYSALSTSGVMSGITYGADRTGDTSSIQAQVQVAHPARGEVRIDVGVGSTSSPAWSYSFYPRMSIGEDTSHANVNTTLDLSDAAAYWPPTASRQWWVRVTDDNKDGRTGTITQFNLISGSTTLSTVTALPVSIPDGGSAYAYIGGAAPVFTSIAVSPSSASVVVNANQQFTATALDQNNNPMSTQPSFSWTVSGGGTISSTGLFTAGSATGGPYTVTAASGGITGSASVTVISQPVQPTLHVSAISLIATNNKSGGQGKATVTVLNNNGTPVSGATVTGTWGGIVGGTSTGTTTTSGNATLSSQKTRASGTITFTVQNITASGYLYDASANTVSTASTTK